MKRWYILGYFVLDILVVVCLVSLVHFLESVLPAHILRSLAFAFVPTDKTETACSLYNFTPPSIYGGVEGTVKITIWSIFINNCHIRTLKLLKSVFRYAWLGWKRIATWKIKAKLFKLFPRVFKKMIFMPWFDFSPQNKVISLFRCSNTIQYNTDV